MTGPELKELFLLEYDFITNFAAPGLTDDEVYSFLNKAQQAFIRQAFESQDMLSIIELVRRDRIATMDYSANIAGGSFPGARFIQLSKIERVTGEEESMLPTGSTPLLPTGYTLKYYINSRSKVTRTYPTITNEWVENVLIDRRAADKMSSTGYNKPRFKHPIVFFDTWYTYQSESPDQILIKSILVVIHDYYTTALPEMELVYIKEPLEITANQGCELKEPYERKIVALAVNDALETVQSPRFQTQAAKPTNQ